MAAATAEILPARLDIKLWRGDTVLVPVQIKESGAPANVTGRTYKAQVRREADGPVVASFTVDSTAAATGVIGLNLNASTTEALAPGSYIWDLEQKTAGSVRTLLAGHVEVRGDVSRDA